MGHSPTSDVKTSVGKLTRLLTFPSGLLALLLAAACESGTPRRGTPSVAAETGSLDVMTAASIAQPMRAVLDSFSAGTGITYALQPGASLELARLVAETNRRPDVLVLADPEVFPKLLAPTFATSYEIIARNRIVLAYTPQSRGAARITSENWRTVITQPGVQVGRADPNTDPSGYRTLLVMQLAARYYHDPSLYQRLLAAAPARNVRPREADQVALLQTHELDYAWTYENLAADNGFEYVKLPDAVDLGTPADSSTYATVSVRVVGTRPGDTLTMRGAPILFAAAVLETAPHPALGRRFLNYLMSAEGRRIARSRHFDVLDSAITVDRDAAPPPVAPHRSRTATVPRPQTTLTAGGPVPMFSRVPSGLDSPGSPPRSCAPPTGVHAGPRHAFIFITTDP